MAVVKSSKVPRSFYLEAEACFEARCRGEQTKAQRLQRQLVRRLRRHLVDHPSFEGWILLGDVYRSVNSSIHAYEKALVLDQNNPEVHAELAIAYGAIGNVRRFQNHAVQALRRLRGHEFEELLLYNIADTAVRLGRVSLANRVRDRGSLRFPKSVFFRDRANKVHPVIPGNADRILRKK